MLQKRIVGTGVIKIKISNSAMVINCSSNLEFFIKCSNFTVTIRFEIGMNSECVILCPVNLVKQL